MEVDWFCSCWPRYGKSHQLQGGYPSLSLSLSLSLENNDPSSTITLLSSLPFTACPFPLPCFVVSSLYHLPIPVALLCRPVPVTALPIPFCPFLCRLFPGSAFSFPLVAVQLRLMHLRVAADSTSCSQSAVAIRTWLLILFTLN